MKVSYAGGLLSVNDIAQVVVEAEVSCPRVCEYIVIL